MKHAVIKTGGKQYLVQKDQILDVELLKEVKKVEFKPLMVFEDSTSRVGNPEVSGATVSAEMVEPEVKDQKITILHYKPKKRIKTKTGHRQRYSRIKITAIS
jgi:large subunit ribosomal protein L21